MNNKYLDIAFKEAKKAFKNDEVPVGCVIVLNDKIIAKSYNKKVLKGDVCAHAEINAIKKATKIMGDWRLDNMEMYITLEPCPMCASVIQQSRIKKIYVGTKSNFKSLEKIDDLILNNKEFYHQVEIVYLNDERCSKILSEFFKLQRIKK